MNTLKTIKYYIKTISIIIIFFYSKSSFAQIINQRLVGRVVNEENNPVESASVKVNNSTICVQTDSMGVFKVDIPNNLFKIEFMVSKNDYYSNSIEINTLHNNDVIIDLEQIKYPPKRVSDESIQNRKQDLKFIRDIILGNSPFGKACKILNENDIVVNSLEKGVIEIILKNNLRILNKDLGYIIEINFGRALIRIGEYFRPLNKNNNYCFFYEQKPKDDKEEERWKKNREKAFNDSFRGFLISMIHKINTKDYGIYTQNIENYNSHIYANYTKLSTEIDEKRLLKVNTDTIVKFDSSYNQFYIDCEMPIIIFFFKNYNYRSIFLDSKYEFTYVSTPTEKLYFNKFGWINTFYKLNGFWANTYYSNMLPQDYLPEKYLK